MYGLEKSKNTAFETDLEKDLKKDPTKAQAKLKEVEGKIQELKGLLKNGAKGPEADQLGAMLQGYTALLKVLNKITHKQ